jgi:hypothetical protein
MRKPDLVIGDPPQTLRWHLFHRWGLQVSLHRWLKSDTDRALHDHSADNISILLSGCYIEWFFTPSSDPRWRPDVPFPAYERRVRIPFVPYFRKAETPHRVELVNGPVWTLWIRFKPRREWGFWCPKGWKYWREYVAEREGYYKTGVSTVGKGCE